MKKVLKKTLSAVCILTLILSMTVVAGAATSPSGTEGGYGSPSAKDDGYGSPTGKEEVDGVQSKTDDVYVWPFWGHDHYPENEKLITSDAGIKQILGNKYKEGNILKLLAYVDIYRPDDKGDSKGGQVTVSVNGVSTGDTIYVLHYDAGLTGEWEVITPDSVDDGEITFTADRFSPFAFVKATNPKVEKEDPKKEDPKKEDPKKEDSKKKTEVKTSDNKKDGTSAKKNTGNVDKNSNAKKSPKTGEF